MTPLQNHPVATREQWLAERRALLAREKELTRLGDEIAAQRRALPWVRIDKPYLFDTPHGPRPLVELFAGRHQFVVQHFMFAPGWPQGCPSCSFMADHTDGALIHLAQRDVSFVAVSRAPLPDIQRFRQRMGWQFEWVSSFENTFNRDFHVTFTEQQVASDAVPYNFGVQAFPQTEAPGISVFVRDDAGEVFHTYSTYGRGVERMMHTYDVLDITPKGRDEAHLEHTMAWVRHHDRYEATPPAVPATGCCSAQR